MRIMARHLEPRGSRWHSLSMAKMCAIGAIAGLVLATGMLVTPQTAIAAPAGAVLIDEMHTLNASNTTLNYGGGTITFDADKGVLTLNGVTIDDKVPSEAGSTNSSIRVTSPGDLTIVLEGDNYLGGSGYGIFANVDSELRITGPGALTIEKDEYAISTFDANLTIDGCQLSIVSSEYGAIDSNVDKGVEGSITIENGADVCVTATSEKGWYAVHAEDDITVSDSTLTISLSGDASNVALFAEKGTLTIDNSTVIAQSSSSYGLYGNEVVIIGSSHVYATGSDGAAMGIGSVSTVKVEDSWVQSSVGINGSLSSSDSVVIEGDAGTATGDVVISGSVEIPQGVTLTIPEGSTVTLPAGAKLMNNGSVILEGKFVNDGGTSVCADGSHSGGTATCEEPAFCALCGKSYGVALGHDWGEPAWSWDDGYTKFVATFTCSNDPSHTEVLTAEPTASVKAEPTCTEAGVRVYTATVELDGTKYTATSEQAIPALGHDFKDGICTVCEAKDPDYVAPEVDEPTLPATGDAGAFFSLVPALAGASALTTGIIARRRR